MKKFSTKYWCITGLGVALFVALSMVLRVPVFSNYYLCLGYVVMSVYIYTVGVLSGTIVGCLGTTIYCLITGMLPGMPGWVFGNLVLGFYLGSCYNLVKCMTNKIGKSVVVILSVLFSTFISIIGVKSFTESILYGDLLVVRVVNNSYAFVADVVILLASYPICTLLDKRLTQIITGRSK